MYSFIIDTSTKNMVLLLYKNNILFDKLIIFYERDHSSNIIENIKTLLEKNNLSLKDIEKIIVGKGPGSYTGIRVSATVAKTLSYVNNIKLFSVSSLELLSGQLLNKELVKQSCRNNNFYIRVYKNNTLVLNDTIFSEQDINLYIEKHNIKNIFEINDTNFLIPNNLDTLLLKEEDVFKFEPDYLRKTPAEENLCK